MYRLKYVIVLALTLFCTPFAQAREPQNLTTAKQAVIRYHDSGTYEKDIQRVINQAAHYLAYRLETSKNHKDKWAIVLDIDETSLSNYPNLVRLNFGGTLADMVAAEAKADAKAIMPTLKFYQYARDHKIAVFFITGRKETARTSTIKNLKAAGFTEWDGLVFKPNDYAQKSVVPYKSAARQALTKQGYAVLINIGDQTSDLQGGSADKTFKLPNPYYLIP